MTARFHRPSLRETLEDLDHSIEDLDTTLEVTNSWWAVFFRGVLFGLGSLIGATIIAAIVVIMLVRTFPSITTIPAFNAFIESTNIADVVEN